MTRIYISGPMSGLPQNNYPVFAAAARTLRGLGYDVVNPAELTLPPNPTWVQCMRICIPALCSCDSVALLPGWLESKGAFWEQLIAARLFGMPCHPIDRLLNEGAPPITPNQAQA